MESHERAVMPGWHRFWSESRNSKHLAVEAKHFVINMVAALSVDGNEHVLDFGSGFGYVAEALAEHVGEVRMWDSAPAVLEAASSRVSADNVTTIDLSDPYSVDLRFDLVVANSVIQYMVTDELLRWLQIWRRLLKPDGTVVISDVPSVDSSLSRETLAWLVFSARNRVLFPSFRFALANWWRYRAAHSASPLLSVDDARMKQLASEAGLRARRLPVNLAYQTSRSSFLLDRQEA